MKVVIALVLLFCAHLALSRVSYHGYKFVHINNITSATKIQTYVEKYNLDVWERNTVENTVTVLVEPDTVGVLMTTELDTVVGRDVQEVFDKEAREIEEARHASEFFDTFRTLDEVNSWLDGVADASPLVTRVRPGLSLEGNEITGVVMGTGDKSIYFICTIHAREWINTPVCNNAIKQLLTNTHLLAQFTWHIFPVVNPDGFLYTWSTDRNWRKNRRVNAGSTYRGVDLNRNFGVGFGGGGSSGNPSSGSFRGPEAFSEPESVVIRDYGRSIENLVGYIDIHCCGNMWMNPWGYECDDVPPDNAAQRLCGQAAVNAIQGETGARWAEGNTCSVIYQASGITSDDMYGAEGVKYAYSIENRSQGSLSNKDYIDYAIRETWAGIKAWAECIAAAEQ